MSKRFDLMNAVYFSPAQLALNAEAQKHPRLMEYMQKHQGADFEVKLAEIARYVGLTLDGTYDKQDIDNICDICITELKKRSTLILLS
jgi:hypothetical protein